MVKPPKFFPATVMKMLTLRKARLPHWQITNTHTTTFEPWSLGGRYQVKGHYKGPIRTIWIQVKYEFEIIAIFQIIRCKSFFFCNFFLFFYFFLILSYLQIMAKIKVNNIKYSKYFLSFQNDQHSSIPLQSGGTQFSTAFFTYDFFQNALADRESLYEICMGLSVFNVLKEERHRHQTMLLLQGSAPRCKRFEL